MSTIPESQIARAGVAGLAAAKVGLGQLKQSAKRPFLSSTQQDEQRETLDEKNAELLFKALTQLRGTAVKLAQVIGMETDLLPEAYRQELQKSWHQVPPLNRVLVRKVIQEEFSTTPEKLFAQFDDAAFAAASLGQVHAAKLHDGTEVVVKIQYPGIGASMNSDIALLRKLLVGLPNRKLILESIDEIQARMQEETDYCRELNMTRWFQENLKLDGVDVPQVYESYSSAKVLTTQLVSGLHLDQWLATAPGQTDIDRAAQRIYDVFIHSSMTLGRLHADPNPGNYLFQKNSHLGLIDFGCTKILSDNFIENFPTLLKAYGDGDMPSIIKANATLGMNIRDMDEHTYEAILKPFGDWVSEPFKADSFDFRKNSNYTSKAKDILHGMSGLSNLDSVADDFIFFDRTIYGMCKLFERMGATVRLRHHWYGDES